MILYYSSVIRYFDEDSYVNNKKTSDDTDFDWSNTFILLLQGLFLWKRLSFNQKKKKNLIVPIIFSALNEGLKMNT